MNPILQDIARSEIRLAIYGIPTAQGILRDLVTYLNGCQTDKQFQEAGMLFAEFDSIKEKLMAPQAESTDSKEPAV